MRELPAGGPYSMPLVCAELKRNSQDKKADTLYIYIFFYHFKLKLHSSFISPLFAPYGFSNFGKSRVSRCQIKIIKNKNGLYPFVLLIDFFSYVYVRVALTTVSFSRSHAQIYSILSYENLAAKR